MIVEDVGCAQDLASDKYPVECEVKNTQNQVPLLEGTQPYNGSDTQFHALVLPTLHCYY